MNRNFVYILLAILAAPLAPVRADVVLDWNATMRQVINDVPQKANPGLSTRAMGMMNAAIYDVFQAFDRTHQPFLVSDVAPAAGANLEAAVARAAREILIDCYAEASATFEPIYASRLAAISDTPVNKDAGEALGAFIAQKYIHKHATDGWDAPGSYTPTGGMGRWWPDPFQPDQQIAWGPAWGNVKTWVMENSGQFDHVMSDIGGLDLASEAYAHAYNQVYHFGSVNSSARSAEQTAIGQFWGYDVPGIGPPPVLFDKVLHDIAIQAGNTPEENARLFAMASVSMADAAIAAWKVKFEHDFWRPVTGIHAGDGDGNPNTAGDPSWQPLGAPGHGIVSPDFTPPFPAYTSGHATMGGALFKSLELFYGTNDFGDIVGVPGATYWLTSDEPGGGGIRYFNSFTEADLAALASDLALVSSPEGENAISRIFLGIHWVFDATDGIRLGNAIAGHVAGNRFLAVPEPGAAVMLLFAAGVGLAIRRTRAISQAFWPVVCARSSG